MTQDTISSFTERVLDLVALLMQKDVVLNSPVDTGRWRASISIHSEPGVRIIGSNVEYGPFIEAGMRGNVRGNFKGKDAFLNAALKARQFADEAVRRLRST